MDLNLNRGCSESEFHGHVSLPKGNWNSLWWSSNPTHVMYSRSSSLPVHTRSYKSNTFKDKSSQQISFFFPSSPKAPHVAWIVPIWRSPFGNPLVIWHIYHPQAPPKLPPSSPSPTKPQHSPSVSFVISISRHGIRQGVVGLAQGGKGFLRGGAFFQAAGQQFVGMKFQGGFAEGPSNLLAVDRWMGGNTGKGTVKTMMAQLVKNDLNAVIQWLQIWVGEWWG